MSAHTPTVAPWQGTEVPSQADIERRLREEGLEPYRWSNAPGDVYGAHTHPYHKVLFVVRGSITFGFPGSGRQVALNPGDRLDLPPGVAHDAVVGPEGVVCLEAHRP
jgi:quercetin dioxygenase-like cupin family protein